MLKMGFLSLFLHLVLVIFLLVNLMSPYIRGGHAVYRVTLRPFSPPGDGKSPGSRGPAPGTLKPPETRAAPLKAEKPKPVESPKGSEALEAAKKDQRTERAEKPEGLRLTKKQKKNEETKNVEGLKKTDSRASLQEALEEIHRKEALDEIQKRVARRSVAEKRPVEGPATLPQAPVASSSPPSSPPSPPPKGSSPVTPGSTAGAGPGRGIGTGTGTATATGTATGTGTGPGGSAWGTSLLESKLNNYYSLIWAKIKEGWTLPEDLPRGGADLETIIVLVIDKGGKLQKSWFEKKSGNTLYDQMAMRAIRKAEPFPPIPRELSEDSLEIGIRFYPE